jgi:hypothetical protein
MQTTEISTKLSSYIIPDTSKLDRTEFSSIVHNISCNKHDPKRASKFGDYAIKIDFSYHEYEVKTHHGERVTSGGIDKRLSSIANLLPSGHGLTNMKRALKKKDETTLIVDGIWDFFRDELDKIKFDRKRPKYYTATVTHAKAKRNLESAAILLVELENKLKVFVFFGELKYSFTTSKDDGLSDKQKEAKFHSSFTVNTNDYFGVEWFENTDLFELDDSNTTDEVDVPTIKPKRTRVSSQVIIKYDIEENKRYASYDELDELLEGIDFEN